MGQWFSCTALFSPRHSTAGSSSSSSSSSSQCSAATKHASLKTPAATAINRRALGTESTLVDSATSHSVTAFPLSTTDPSHLSTSPPRHRRYLSAPSFASVPCSSSTSASPPPPVCSPPPQPAHFRSSSASSCSSTGLASSVAADTYPTIVMTRTSSHVDDIIEEVVEPVPSPPSYTATHTLVQQPSSNGAVEEAEEASGEVRCVALIPVSDARVLSPRSVLAFMIVNNGGECDTADESNWEDEVHELHEQSDDDTHDALSMRDILASLPTTSTTYMTPFPANAPSYPSAPSLAPASTTSLRPSSRYSTTSLSYPSLTALARHTAVRQPNSGVRRSTEQAESEEEDEELEYAGGDWRDDTCVGVSTRSIHSAQWTSVASGM